MGERAFSCLRQPPAQRFFSSEKKRTPKPKGSIWLSDDSAYNRAIIFFTFTEKIGYLVRMNEKADTISPNQLRPSRRKRGIERYELLLDAAAAVLGQRPNEDISLAQIAENAGVPLASVYHFFPNRNAALEALASRYHGQIFELAMTEGSNIPDRWQDVFIYRLRRSAAFLNSEPAALRLFMGAGVSVEIRNVDVSGNAAIATRRAEYLREVFDLPAMPELEKRIAISLALIDGIWALSYAMHGHITDEYVEEAVLAALTYLRCYLPEHLQKRATVS